MKPARAVTATLPRRALSQLVNAGATGALHVAGHPGGVLYLTKGQVSHAESPAAPDVGDLLTAAGRISVRTWESAVSAGKDAHRVGRLLVEQGHLTDGELELCVLGVIYDAAYFVLQPAAVPVRFEEDEQHWLGPVCRVDADVLSRETTRRRRLLDEIFESSAVDTAPVRPAPRSPVERVVLSALQFELLVAADGARTPAALARLLGRAGYVTLQQVRELAAAGLISTAPESGAAIAAPESDAAVTAPEERTTGAAPEERTALAPEARTAAAAPEARTAVTMSETRTAVAVSEAAAVEGRAAAGRGKRAAVALDEQAATNAPEEPTDPIIAMAEAAIAAAERAAATAKPDLLEQATVELDARGPATAKPATTSAAGRAGSLRAAVPVHAPGRAAVTAVVDPPATGPATDPPAADHTATRPPISPAPPPVVEPADPEKPGKPVRRATGGRRRAGARAAAVPAPIPADSLPRRSPGEQMPAGAGAPETVPGNGPLRADAPDEALLTRIRSALKALR